MKELRIKLRVLARTYGLDYLDEATIDYEEPTGEPTLVLRGEKR